jgi:hypothetical protein
MKRAAIYLRGSTMDQHTSKQETGLRQAAERAGWEVVKVYKDHGIRYHKPEPDTSVVHLAGALGKPIWILLHHAADWRWPLDRSASSWYPTARLFRQTRLEDWKDVIGQVRTELIRIWATE